MLARHRGMYDLRMRLSNLIQVSHCQDGPQIVTLKPIISTRTMSAGRRAPVPIPQPGWLVACISPIPQGPPASGPLLRTGRQASCQPSRQFGTFFAIASDCSSRYCDYMLSRRPPPAPKGPTRKRVPPFGPGGRRRANRVASSGTTLDMAPDRLWDAFCKVPGRLTGR